MRLLKVIGISLVMALIASSGWCAWDATKPRNNEKLKDTPALIRANWDAIATGTDASLQVTNAKVSASAGIVDTKLATISTAGKVNAGALTALSSTPSGAGALPLANGGTGQVTRQASLDALLDVQTGKSGYVLKSDGSNASWGYPADLSIASQATGDLLYFDGTNWKRLAKGTQNYPLVAGATIPSYAQVGLTTGVTGTLPVANGGTGTTSLTDIGLPAQGSANGKYLTSNGSVSSWGTITAPTVKTIICGQAYPGASDVYFPLSGMSGSPTNSQGFRTYFPIAGTLKNLYVSSESTFTTTTIYKNGSATALTTYGTGNASDTTHTVSVSAGDYIQINLPTQINTSYAVEFDPT